jgi:hypothetical protein
VGKFCSAGRTRSQSTVDVDNLEKNQAETIADGLKMSEPKKGLASLDQQCPMLRCRDW